MQSNPLDIKLRADGLQPHAPVEIKGDDSGIAPEEAGVVAANVLEAGIQQIAPLTLSDNALLGRSHTYSIPAPTPGTPPPGPE